ncbi:MAG: hypothetical protein Q4B54_03350 [Coriobacteriales bacterium]|nr:hypothetical protein [Coriobacteriales bacterium]
MTSGGQTAKTEAIGWKVTASALSADASTEAVALGVKGTLTCAVTGAEATNCSYQWQWSSDMGATWKNLSWAGADTASLSQTVTAGRAACQIYRCVVTAFGDVHLETNAIGWLVAE